MGVQVSPPALCTADTPQGRCPARVRGSNPLGSTQKIIKKMPEKIPQFEEVPRPVSIEPGPNGARFEFFANSDKSQDSYKVSLTRGEGEEQEFLCSMTFEFFQEPEPFYYMEYIDTPPKYQSRGFASLVLDRFIKKLDEEGRVGVLMNAISKEDGPVHGMYARHGFKPVAYSDKEEWMYYSGGGREVPEEVIKEMISSGREGNLKRIIDSSERSS